MKRPKTVRKVTTIVKPEESKNFGWIYEFVKLVAAGLIASIATVWASTLDYWNQDRELDIRMVDVALTILSAKIENTKSQYARAYALELLENFGGVKIEDKEEWAANGDLPVGKFPSWISSERSGLYDLLLGPNAKEAVQRQQKSDFLNK